MSDPLASPPPSWPQKAGRLLPFPPGDGSDKWDVVLWRDAGSQEWERYHVRSTGEVYQERNGRFYQPTWPALPAVVRRRVHDLA